MTKTLITGDMLKSALMQYAKENNCYSEMRNGLIGLSIDGDVSLNRVAEILNAMVPQDSDTVQIPVLTMEQMAARYGRPKI